MVRAKSGMPYVIINIKLCEDLFYCIRRGLNVFFQLVWHVLTFLNPLLEPQYIPNEIVDANSNQMRGNLGRFKFITNKSRGLFGKCFRLFRMRNVLVGKT